LLHYVFRLNIIVCVVFHELLELLLGVMEKPRAELVIAVCRDCKPGGRISV